MYNYLYVDISRQTTYTDLTFTMSHRISIWISLPILLFICRDFHCLAKTDFRYMTNYCSKTVLVEDSLVLVLTSPETLSDNRDRDFLHCDVVLQAPEAMKLLTHFLQLQISPIQDHSDRLHFFDLTPNATRLTPAKGLFGSLDRTTSQFDDAGVQVDDYRTLSNQMKVDYLGKPTSESAGFRVLVTNIQDPTYNGQCPVKHYFCRHKRLCIPRQLCCDGNHNCGNGDAGDENECDRYNTATDLLAGYSLTRDIIVVILLPLAIFIATVIMIFLSAQRYIREKIDIPVLPAVHFTPRKDETKIYAPPSYEDTLHVSQPFARPSTYNDRTYSEDCPGDTDSGSKSPTSNYQQREGRQKVELGDFTGSGRTPVTVPKYVNMQGDYDRPHRLLPSETADDQDKINRHRKCGQEKVTEQSDQSRLEVSKLL